MPCWKCQGRHTDASGYCRTCGADMFHPPREPNEADKARRYQGNPGAGSRKRSVVKSPPNG